MVNKPLSAENMAYLKRLETNIIKKFKEIANRASHAESGSEVLVLIHEVRKLRKSISNMKEKILKPLKASNPLNAEIGGELTKTKKALNKIEEELRAKLLGGGEGGKEKEEEREKEREEEEREEKKREEKEREEKEREAHKRAEHEHAEHAEHDHRTALESKAEDIAKSFEHNQMPEDNLISGGILNAKKQILASNKIEVKGKSKVRPAGQKSTPHDNDPKSP